MSKMTKEELKKRKAELKKLVHAEIVRREVLQFRLEPENIDRLYRIAAKKRKPVGTLIREWMIEKINLEAQETNIYQAVTPDYLLLNVIRDKLQSGLEKSLEEIKITLLSKQSKAKGNLLRVKEDRS